MKFNLTTVTKGMKSGWDKNGQIVLAVVAAGSAIGAVISAIKAGPKAASIKEEQAAKLEDLMERLKEKEINSEGFKKEQHSINIEAVKGCVVTYIPTAALLGISIGATACGYQVSIGKQAMLLGAYKALENRNGELEKKARELLGDEKFEAIENSIVQDTWSGRYFHSTPSKIRAAMIDASDDLGDSDQMSIAEIHDYISPSELVATECSENYGFISNDLNSNKMIPYSIGSAIKDDRSVTTFTLGNASLKPALLTGMDSCRW